jgi:hypothetical protein
MNVAIVSRLPLVGVGRAQHNPCPLCYPFRVSITTLRIEQLDNMPRCELPRDETADRHFGVVVFIIRVPPRSANARKRILFPSLVVSLRGSPNCVKVGAGAALCTSAIRHRTHQTCSSRIALPCRRFGARWYPQRTGCASVCATEVLSSTIIDPDQLRLPGLPSTASSHSGALGGS